MKVAWDPLALASVTGVIAAFQYFREEAPRWCGFFAAATVVFATAGIRPLLALAHHPMAPGFSALVVMIGTVGAALMFWFVVFKGHHNKPLVKRRGSPAAAGSGQQGGGSKSKKAPHHKAMLATVGVMAFTFLLAANWHAIVQTGSGGFSQTYNGITR